MDEAMEPLDDERLAALIQSGNAWVRLRPLIASRLGEPSEILQNNLIYFTPASAQDDIYEGRPRFRWRAAPTSREEVVELVRRKAPHLARPQRRRRVAEMLKRVRDPVQLEAMKHSFLEKYAAVYRDSSIVSFFKDPARQSFWATNYADQGHGYGLVFDFSAVPWPLRVGEDLQINAVPFPVVYIRPPRPEIELAFAPADPEASFRDIEAALLTKSDEWGHQGEERLIRLGIPAGHARFPEQSLRALILGYRLDPDERTLLRRLAKERAMELPVFQAFANEEGGFALHLRRID